MIKGSKRPAASWKPADPQAKEKKYGKEKTRVSKKQKRERLRNQVLSSWGRPVC
jgi:hypothetical protein